MTNEHRMGDGSGVPLIHPTCSPILETSYFYPRFWNFDYGTYISLSVLVYCFRQDSCVRDLLFYTYMCFD